MSCHPPSPRTQSRADACSGYAEPPLRLGPRGADARRGRAGKGSSCYYGGPPGGSGSTSGGTAFLIARLLSGMSFCRLPIIQRGFCFSIFSLGWRLYDGF